MINTDRLMHLQGALCGQRHYHRDSVPSRRLLHTGDRLGPGLRDGPGPHHRGNLHDAGDRPDQLLRFRGRGACLPDPRPHAPDLLHRPGAGVRIYLLCPHQAPGGQGQGGRPGTYGHRRPLRGEFSDLM